MTAPNEFIDENEDGPPLSPEQAAQLRAEHESRQRRYAANRPAFPVVVPNEDGNAVVEAPGLTKREFFAAMAMQGYLASGMVAVRPVIAQIAVMQADALLAELAKEPAR